MGIPRVGESIPAQMIGSGEGIRVALEPNPPLMRVTIDNPPGNRFGLAQVERLNEIAGRLAEMVTDCHECRAIVLDAAGVDFSHGANLSDPELVARMTQGRLAQVEFARCGQSLVSRWRAIPVPTVAIGKGHVIGAGACLFFASDFRIAAPTTQVRFPEIDRAMHLGWGIVPRLMALLGESRTLRLALLGESLEIQSLADVVTATDDPDRESVRLVTEICSKAPLALRSILCVLRQSQHGMTQAAEKDAEQWAETLASKDFAEAMAAWYAHRLPVWKGC